MDYKRVQRTLNILCVYEGNKEGIDFIFPEDNSQNKLLEKIGGADQGIDFSETIISFHISSVGKDEQKSI